MLAYALNRPPTPKPKVGFTVVSKQTVTPSEGQPPRHGYTEVRYQRSDGSWKQVNTYASPDGKFVKEDIGYGLVGRGVFQADRKNRVLYFLSSMEPESVNLTTDLRRAENYVRDDSVLGYETRVLRFPSDDGTSYTESYYAPALQNVAIKSVSVSEGGTSVTEAVEIRLGEPPEGEFAGMLDWPVRYDRYEEKIQVLEDRGRRDTAEQMRQLLDRQRQGKPHR